MGGGGGGAVDVLVSHKLSLPHEHILGRACDQLNLTQFIQGFVKNVLKEENKKYENSRASIFSRPHGGCYRLLLGKR